MKRIPAIFKIGALQIAQIWLRMAIVVGALAASTSVTAQGWQRYYTGERLFGLQLLPDGSLAAAGAIRDAGTPTDGYWLHADAFGNVISETRFGADTVNEQVQSIFSPAAGEWLLCGNSDGEQIFQAKLDEQGYFIYPPQSLTTGLIYKTAAAGQGNWLFCGSRKNPNGAGNNITLALSGMVDAAGQLVWQRTDSIGWSSAAVDVMAGNNGDFWLAGHTIDTVSGLSDDAFLLKINANGAVLSTSLLQLPDNEIPEKIVALPGGVLIAGSVSSGLSDDDIWLAVADDNGAPLWSKSIPMPGFQQVHAAAVLPGGELIFAGETRPTLAGSRDAFLARTDAAGNLIWFKTYGGIKGDIFWDIAVLPDGGVALAGQSASFGDGKLHAWLVRTDAQGNLWTNHVSGKVAQDEVQDCLVAVGENPLAGWLVSAAGNDGIYYALTDSTGRYDILLDTGVWYISALPPVDYWLPCMDSVAVNLASSGDSVAIDFPVQALYNCPLLQVDISTPYLRRCFENQYVVRWFNYGTTAAVTTNIAVIPDPFLTITGSTMPYTLAGDTLWFDVGETPSLTGGSLQFSAVLDCDSTVLGQTHCTTAWIAPDSLCTEIDPEWDGASLDVNGYCAGDSVILQITNTGLGNMQQAVEYVIIEDQVIFKREPLLLAAGADTTFVLYPNGATITLIVNQTPGHPGNSMPTLVIEGCGAVPFSTGFALQFPADDGNPFVDTECRQNIGSFDPNDKTGAPQGVDNENIIAAGDAIEYLIRFQNTGTDTAFRVEIRDTLPGALDLSTLEWGAASHPCRSEVMGPGVLRFLFSPIALPDSAANAAASQGFVKYRIKTRTDLPDGTVVRNGAAIYFDFNAPVLTDKTMHTIGRPLDELPVVGAGEILTKRQSSCITVNPNPFVENTVLTWPSAENGIRYRVEILHSDGQVSACFFTNENQFFLSEKTLPAGFYTLRVIAENGKNASGKFIKTH